jgi:hypothetical protein
MESGNECPPPVWNSNEYRQPVSSIRSKNRRSLDPGDLPSQLRHEPRVAVEVRQFEVTAFGLQSLVMLVEML